MSNKSNNSNKSNKSNKTNNQNNQNNDKISPNNQCQIITNNHYQIIMK